MAEIAENSKKSGNILFYAKSSLKGVLAGASVFLLAHPIDVLKTRMQADPSKYRNKSIKALKDTYKLGGIKLFYAGSLPNFARYSIRNMYRWPMMLFFPSLYGNFLSKSKAKLLSAFTIANLECLIISPLERLKTYLMTRDMSIKSPLVFFFSNKDNRSIKELYRGVTPLILRQNASWFSFLYFDYKLKKIFVDRRVKNGKSNVLSFSEINTVSVMVACTNTFSGKYL